jgi:Uma2 family endonuclease
MQEYRENGVRLGWLINPQDQTVKVYRRTGEVEVLSFPIELAGEDVLPDFGLRLP